MKKASDFKAWNMCRGYIILREDGEHVATIYAHYADSGRVTVTVYDFLQEGTNVQTASAGGYGYDKFTAALSGMSIDGHKLTDHCGEQLQFPECGYWSKDVVPLKGYMFSNWDRGVNGWKSCYRLSGFEYLRALGYRIFSVG